MFNVSTADKGFTLHLNCLYQTTGEFPDNFNLEKLGNFNAGFRYEHVGFDYTDHLDAANNMTRYQNEFFPSLSWARQFGPVQTSLAYSFKTIRPN